VYVDPYYADNTNVFACYYKRTTGGRSTIFNAPPCRRTGQAASGVPGKNALSGGDLRTYRLACAATGEYTTFFGGSVAQGMAAIVTAINRVSGIYESNWRSG